jgi:predicted nucleic acid-binding protein
MRTLVVDASVMVKWLNQDRELHTEEAMEILHRGALGRLRLVTSELAFFEVLNALIRGKGLVGNDLEVAVRAVFKLPVRRLPLTLEDAAVAAILCEHRRLTFYDAAYMALARSQLCPLVTANPKDQKNAPGIQVISVSDARRWLD